MVFQGHRSNAQALAEAQDIPAARRLAWFNHGFMRAQVADGELVLSDLRMGSEPDYFFSYAVARREGDGWQAASPPRQLDLQRDFGPVWQATWHRIWNDPCSASALLGAAMDAMPTPDSHRGPGLSHRPVVGRSTPRSTRRPSGSTP